MPTVGTALGRRIELINLDKRPSIPLRFVFELTHQFTPSHVTDRLGKVVIAQHVLDGKALDADHLVLVNDARRELVLIVPSPISNPGMETSHFEPCLRSVLRTFLLLSKSTLGFRQLLFVFAEELRVAHVLPCREDHHRLESQVKPDLRVSHGQRFDIFLDEDGDEVASGGILGDRDRGGPASLGQWTTPMDVERLIHLGQGEVGSIPLEGRGGVFSGLLSMSALPGGIVGTAFKEVPEGFFQVAKRLLGRNAGDIVEPGVIVLLFQASEACRQLVVAKAFLPFIVGIRSEPQCPIVDIASTAKRTSKDVNLLISRIHSVLVRTFLVHSSHCSTCRVKSQQAKTDIHS